MTMYRTDDPSADYDRYCNEQDAWLERLPKCSYCNEPIQDDFCFEINDELICEECLDMHHKKCVEDYV